MPAPRFFYSSLFALTLSATFSVQATESVDPWQKINVPLKTYQVKDANGEKRDITPSCSGGPVCTTDPSTGAMQCHLGNPEYSFFFKKGLKDKVVVFFDEGGACWDDNTCVTANLSPQPVYVPEIGPDSDPTGKGGLFNLTNENNPYRDWSMVVLPYCTGDIHWGSKDQTYADITGLVTGTPGGEVTIHHRGFDNFLYVRQWMTKNLRGMNKSSGKMLVTGASAGSYGAPFAYPHLKKAFPKAKGYLMADSGDGVLSENFLQQSVSGMDAHWNIEPNLAHWIPGMDALPSTSANQFSTNFYFDLASYYAQDRFSQYSTHWDSIQALFYNIMLHPNDMSAWSTLTLPVYASWVQQGLGNLATNSSIANYRYFVGQGCNHTLLARDDDFYTVSTNHPIQFIDWFKALTETDENSNWQNSYCLNCEVPPTTAEIQACVARSLPTNP